MPRLFVGTFLSEENVDKVLALSRKNAHLDRLWNTKVRWVAPSKLHITWLFLGDVKTESLADVKSILRECVSGITLSSTNLILQYDRFELWPSQRKAKLGVITANIVPDDVSIIAERIEKALKKFIPKEERAHEQKGFKPHLTVMRFSRDRKPRKKTGSENNAPMIFTRGLPENNLSIMVPALSQQALAYQTDLDNRLFASP